MMDSRLRGNDKKTGMTVRSAEVSKRSARITEMRERKQE